MCALSQEVVAKERAASADNALLGSYAVDFDALTLRSKVGKGGFGIVYRAEFNRGKQPRRRAVLTVPTRALPTPQPRAR